MNLMSFNNPSIDELKIKGWIPVSSQEHILGSLRGKSLGSYKLLPLIGPKNRFGAVYFQLFLLDKESNISRQPAIIGLHHHGIYPAYNWIEIINMAPQVDFDSGEKVFFSFTPGNLTKPLFKHLINLISPGGHIMVEYDSPERWATARLLASGIPPVVTHIGYTYSQPVAMPVSGICTLPKKVTKGHASFRVLNR